jgi:RHS repeat-associated protein
VDGVLVRTSVNGVGVDCLVDTSGGLSHVVVEIQNGAVGVVYVRAGDMLLEEVRGGVAKMYEADGLGSVRGLLDVSGTRTDTYSYEAFGSTVSSTGSDQNPYRFAGERLVDSVGFYQNRARWMDTRTGRFVSVDPLVRRTGSPYLYARNSPAARIDPTGAFDSMVGVGVTMAMQSGLANMSTPAPLHGTLGAGVGLDREFRNPLFTISAGDNGRLTPYWENILVPFFTGRTVKPGDWPFQLRPLGGFGRTNMLSGALVIDSDTLKIDRQTGYVYGNREVLQAYIHELAHVNQWAILGGVKAAARSAAENIFFNWWLPNEYDTTSLRMWSYADIDLVYRYATLEQLAARFHETAFDELFRCGMKCK